MKFLIIGLGSMGKRRTRNLQYLGHNDILGCDLDEGRRKDAEKAYGIATCKTIEEGFSTKPDAAIISTPPDRHYDIATLVAKQGIPFFMEANVIPEGFDKLARTCKENNVFYAPSCTMRFQSSIRKVKELIDQRAIGSVLHFTYHVGQYLPDWHPYEDYRKFYVSKKSTGACREIVPFELSWITWTMGDVSLLTGMRRKLSKLETEIDDIYSFIVEFKDGKIGTMVIDVLARLPYRTLKIIGDEGIITWEWVDKSVRLYNVKNKEWQEFKEPPGMRIPGYVAEEDMYIEEMRSYINGLKTPAVYIHQIEEEQMLMDILKSIESSSDEKTQRHIK
jgi:predicted dehydrogenase